jgi:hypothetical protein
VGVQPQPWEQRPDESPRAYAAFVAYRDMGAARSVDATAAGIAGHQGGTKRAPGHFKRWSVEHQWSARARAYDEHQASLRQRGVEQATVKAGRDWGRRRDAYLEDEYRTWSRFARQAAMIGDLPPVRQVVEKDGRTTVYEPANVETIRQAAVIAEKASANLAAVIERGLALENESAIERARAESYARPDGALSDADQRYEAWQASKRRQILTLDLVNPPVQPSPEPEPPAAARNGSGVPPVPASST